MNDVERRIKKFIWRERLRVLAIPLAIIAVLSAAIWYVNRGEWTSSEIEVVMRNITAQEDDTRIEYRALVEKSDGTIIHVKMPQSSHFKAGDKAIVMESVNLDSGKKRYRYLRPSTDS